MAERPGKRIRTKKKTPGQKEQWVAEKVREANEEQHKSMVEVRSRLAAFMGALVGDAAAQTSHWNYQQNSFHKALKQAGRFGNPEFFQKNKYYTIPPGGHSCYGIQCLTIASQLTANGQQGTLCADASKAELVARFEKDFGARSEFGPWPVKGKLKTPVKGPYRHGSIRGFLTNFYSVHNTGAMAKPPGIADTPTYGDTQDKQVDCVVKAVPVVCMHAGKPGLMQEVEAAIRVTQNNDEAVRSAQLAAAILEAFILGQCTTVEGAIDAARARLGSEHVPSTFGCLQTFLRNRQWEGGHGGDGSHGHNDFDFGAVVQQFKKDPTMVTALKAEKRVALVA